MSRAWICPLDVDRFAELERENYFYRQPLKHLNAIEIVWFLIRQRIRRQIDSIDSCSSSRHDQCAYVSFSTSNKCKHRSTYNID
jgi:hypothetical protein